MTGARPEQALLSRDTDMSKTGATRSVIQAMAITVPFGVPMFIGFAMAMGGFEAMRGWGVAPWAWMALAGARSYSFANTPGAG